MPVWQPERNWTVKQADSKNGELENSERTFSLNGVEPPRLHLDPRWRASKRRIGKDVRSSISTRGYSRNDKTPRESTHGVLRLIRTAEFSGWYFGSPGRT